MMIVEATVLAGLIRVKYTEASMQILAETEILTRRAARLRYVRVCLLIQNPNHSRERAAAQCQPPMLPLPYKTVQDASSYTTPKTIPTVTHPYRHSAISKTNLRSFDPSSLFVDRKNGQSRTYARSSQGVNAKTAEGFNLPRDINETFQRQ